jgi:HD-GYP domain-containing protein (c-di-GMP phosphodiesterase class II)
MVAREYGLTDDQVRVIRYAALMHDVGKLGVSNSVLKKPGKLTVDEYEEMKIHPSRAVEIVGEIDFLRDAIDGIRHHHERLDGLGYPDGLAGERVPFVARLIMVADAFDSMTSTRRYRKAKTIEEAFAELHRCAGTQFDAQSIAALERAITKVSWVPVPEPRDEAESDARAASI